MGATGCIGCVYMAGHHMNEANIEAGETWPNFKILQRLSKVTESGTFDGQYLQEDKCSGDKQHPLTDSERLEWLTFINENDNNLLVYDKFVQYIGVEGTENLEISLKKMLPGEIIDFPIRIDDARIVRDFMTHLKEGKLEYGEGPLAWGRSLTQNANPDEILQAKSENYIENEYNSYNDKNKD